MDWIYLMNNRTLVSGSLDSEVLTVITGVNLRDTLPNIVTLQSNAVPRAVRQLRRAIRVGSRRLPFARLSQVYAMSTYTGILTSVSRITAAVKIPGCHPVQ